MLTFLEQILDQMQLLRQQLIKKDELGIDKGRAFDLLQGIADSAKEIERLVALKGK